MTQSSHPPSQEARSTIIGDHVYVDLAFVDRSPVLISIDEHWILLVPHKVHL